MVVTYQFEVGKKGKRIKNHLYGVEPVRLSFTLFDVQNNIKILMINEMEPLKAHFSLVYV